MGRPLIKYGSFGPDVLTVQKCLGCKPLDSDFGSITEEAVTIFQRNQNLSADGVVGTDTWTALERKFSLPPYPPPMMPPLSEDQISAICDLAKRSPIATYNWRDRGKAPLGYTMGMALAWSTAYRKFMLDDSSAREMAKANTGDDATDALSWYDSNFKSLGMPNDAAGADTLRHLFVLLMGLGMRESGGKHCEGRDMSTSNVSSDTAEAGLFQMSWNLSTATIEIPKLFDAYAVGLTSDPPLCALHTFKEDVSCSSSSWSTYGSGKGRDYQKLAKSCPQFSVEMAAVGLRFRRQHWGPINRKEAELKIEADHLFHIIQRHIETSPLVA